MTYALLGLIALVLLAGLVAFGVGHKRWSWGTLIAAFLVLLTAAGYLYLVSRFAAYDWAWAKFVRSKQEELARVQDALVPDRSNGGRLKPIGGDDAASRSIAELTKERERWQRAFDRIDTWRDRSWAKASFTPPKADGATGKLEIPFPTVAAPAVEGDAAADEPPKPDTAPLDPGATVYVFEKKAFKNGGRYLGAFRVDSSTLDKESRCFVLTVLQTAARDPIDDEMWGTPYDYDDKDDETGVTVYESLPLDRWAASPGQSIDKLSIDEIETMLDERDRQGTSLDQADQADQAESQKTAVEKAEWERIRKRLDDGDEPPGSYWALVKFKESAVIAEGIEDEAASRSFEPGETAECDLQRAFALADEGKATIEEVRYRRRLQDAGTFIHGSRIFRGTGADASKESIAADGVAGLVAVLRREITAIEASTTRLAESRTDVEAELKATADRRRRLAADKELWDRDATAAERTAEAFAAEVTQTRKRLATTEQAIVAQGNELREAVGRLVERIDAVAPAPTQPAAAAP